MTTATTGSLAAALAKAQQEMPSVGKDGTNPHFRNRFVTLDNLIEKTRPVLNNHGLTIMQFPSVSELGAPTLTTRIMHTSGETVEYQMPLFLVKQDMQAFGSAITYARRYAWAAALGIASDEDDDGNQATASARPAAAASSNGGERESAAKKEPAASAAQQKKLDRLIANLANFDASKDWADIADRYAQREFGHGRSQLTTIEIEQTVATLNGHLESMQVPA